ncbi:HNH endonuclease [Massilia sp. CCM 8734]|uniref:HNH endonuclease n=1 Tax=Massilia sp. CCM 8734 TaxID=2609283 RepID=UPI0014249FB9|nr:HNH endonuclease [Massilia sp. CCM 8734]NHZ94571.1 hypothetical protein [Massilia sp. CCM 8734]
MDKKTLQLGMNPSTAANRLKVDLLFSFAIKLGHKCHRCNAELVRDNFSVEHMTPWLDSADPKGAFFDLENIAFSHLSCNSRVKRDPRQVYFTVEERRIGRTAQIKQWKQSNYSPKKRAEKFQRTGT